MRAPGIRRPCSCISFEKEMQTVAGNHNPKTASDSIPIDSPNRCSQQPPGKTHARSSSNFCGILNELEPGTALKVALASLPATKANIRSALNRATHKKGLRVATSSDARHFYLWKVTGKS